MRRSRRVASLPLLALAWPSAAAAAGSARVCLAVEGALSHARLEGEAWARPARIEEPGQRACFFDVPAGQHRIVATTPAGAETELALEVLPGEDVEVSARGGEAPELILETRGRMRPGTGFGQRRLRELPGSGEPWSLLETAETAVIADRIDGGGLWAGVPGRTSTHGSSWTQASFVTSAHDLTDPLRTGIPLGWPALTEFAAFDAATAALPVEAGAPGTLVVLERAAPPARWSLAAEGSTTLGEGRAAGPAASTPTSGPEPPLARHERSRRLSLAAGGPLTGSLRASVFGVVEEARRFERGGAEPLGSEVAAGAVRALWTPGAAQELDLHADAQSLRRPFAGRALFASEGLRERDRVGGLDAQWRLRAPSGSMAWAAAGHRRASLDADAGSAPGTFERLLDGPAAALPLPGVTRRARTSAAFGVALAARRLGGGWHAVRLGVQAARTSADIEPAAAPVLAGELLGGLPARAWSIRADGESAWRGDDLALHASDAMAFGRALRLEAGLRLETSGVEARGAAASVRWTALSPRLAARWEPARAVSLFAAYGHYRHRLPLSLAAWGDPSAPRADVFLWADANGDGAFAPAERGALVARSGPGAPVGALDGSLRPARTEEVVAGVEGRLGRVRVALVGVHRQETGLAESVNVGVPASAYTVRFVPDPAGDLAGPQDDQMLPLYSRPAATFGADTFLLTNPDGHGTRHQGVELTVEVLTGRLQVLLGATAHRSEGSGAFRGFRPGENDQGLVGDLFDDPNAATHSRGRLFSDRAYTIKLSGSWRAPGGVTLGAAARYQDGQPFSRLVLAALPQGLTPVHAIPNGRARFTFIATLDARAEKELALGGARRAAVVLEGFNLTQRGNEVEEVVVSGGAYRAVTFRQPPRLVRLGLRLSL